jgi:hypothetical protein
MASLKRGILPIVGKTEELARVWRERTILLHPGQNRRNDQCCR